VILAAKKMNLLKFISSSVYITISLITLLKLSYHKSQLLLTKNKTK
jgi:hypothetical protein